MLRYDQKQYIMLTSTSGLGLDTEFIEGVVLGHAYTLLSVHKAQTASGDEAHLLKIRNPWGEGSEWRGDWSDYSKLWTDNERKRLKLKEEQDGTFFISV